tara:strand:+ start:77 stop:490 length:414 start_codon:yes stop_codon:yes gene_type:complete
MIAIYHNPDCGTSRNALRLIEASGDAYVVVDYLREGWTRAQLTGLFAAASLTPRSALRETKSPAKELGLLAQNVSEEAILAEMLAHPVLVNRPIVCSSKGVKLCRPSTAVIQLLSVLPSSIVTGEGGEMLYDPATVA